MIAKGWLVSFGIVALISASAHAAPPEVTSLFPAGCQRGTSVSVTIQGKLEGAGHVWCSRPGVKVTLPEKPGPITIEVAANTEPGVCWLRFFNDEGASGLRPFVIGTCPEILEVELNDDVRKPQTLRELPVVVNGQHIKNGDSDLFAVTLRKGQTVVASLMANRTLGSPQDAVLQILGPTGFVLEQNEDDQGFDPQLAFTAPDDGIYIIRTWAFPATPDSSIRLFGSPACAYRLSVTTGPFVDHLLPTAVQAGSSQKIHVRGWNLPQTEVDLVAPVSAIGRRFDWVLEGWSHLLPASVVVQPFETTIEQEPNDLARAQSISLPISVTGEISQDRDVDAFQFTAKKGTRYRFEVIAREMGSPLDAVLRIYDAKGKLLKEADDDGRQSIDPDVEYTLPSDGDFRVTVTDRYLHSGERYAYLLSITEVVPDFAVSVASDAFVLSAGKDLEIPVTVTRPAEFSEEISIEVVGLPAGVTATAVKSAAKGDSSKAVKLIVKTNGEAAYSGPIQIVGRSSTAERIATVSLKSFQAEVTHVWLTMRKK